MKQVFTFLFTIILFGNVYPQSNKVELKILSSETGYSLVPEQIQISNINREVSIDLKNKVDNYYAVNLTEGKYLLSVRKEGYSACESYFSIEGKDIKYDIYLDPVVKNPLLKTDRIKSLMKDNASFLLGYVVDDETGEPLNSVIVKDESNSNASTNANGYFEFYLQAVCEKRSFVNLTFNKAGYSVEEYKDFELFPNTDFIFTVRLKKEKSQVFIQNNKLTEPVCDECNNKEPLLNPPVSGFVLPVNIRVGRNCTGTNCSYAQVYSIETYCKYVLPAEIYSCWGNISGGMNSLQACAVAVRTYGVYYVYNPINPSLYDICDNTYCQYMGNVTSNNTNNAVDNTFRNILVNSGGVVRSEYSAENNNKGCGNGYSGTGSSWPCIFDPVCTNGTPNGHGRGLCQWGTVRWATGTLVYTSSPCSPGPPHSYGNKTWQQILNHYYNVSPQNWTVYLGITATMISSSCLPQATNPCSTITITNSINATSTVSLMLGASIAPVGTTNWISDPSHDVKLTFNQGTGSYNRSFTIPCSIQPGTYDLLTAVWYD
ncbi:MAG TPA: SpoIID/LytB domain-containing protein, partial [Ignavibacteria bacterium]